MNDINNSRWERDDLCKTRLCAAIDTIQNAFKSWLEEEIKDTKPIVQGMSVAWEGELKIRFESLLERLEYINLTELRIAHDHANGVRQEMQNGGEWIAPDAARLTLEQCVWKLEQLVRELMKLRGLIDGYTSPSDPQAPTNDDPDPTDDESDI